MYEGLYKVIGTLPDSTLVFGGHEYTRSNLRFASFIEPENEKIRVCFGVILCILIVYLRKELKR